MRDVSELVRNALGTSSAACAPKLIGEASSFFLEDGVVLRDYEIRLRGGESCFMTVASPPVQKFPFPVIAAHQTNQTERKEVFGLAEDTSLAYGLMLARRGHKVYGIDLRSTGERGQGAQWDLSGFRDKYPEWSPLGADCQDFEDLIYLMRSAFGEQLPFNWIGHSHGAINGFVLAASQPAGTFAGVVCNAGFAGFADQAAVLRQAYLERYFNSRFSSEALLGLDEIISLACQKSRVRLNCYQNDEIVLYPLPTKAQSVKLDQVGQQLELAVYDGQHTFPHYIQINSARFLECRSLGHKGGSSPYLPWLSAQRNSAGADGTGQANISKSLHLKSFGCIGINTTEHGCTILSSLIEAGLPPEFVLVSAETDEQLEHSAPYFGRQDWLTAVSGSNLRNVAGQHTLAGLASAARIPTLFVPGLSSNVAVDLARNAQVDIIFLLEAPVLRGDILEAAKTGVINFHAAPLPCYRGSNATLWALYHDEPLEVWAHFVEAGVDAGDLICSLPLPVFRSDDIDTLATRACRVSANLAVQLICQARGEGLVVTRQDARRAQRFRGPMPAAVREACQNRLALGQYSFYVSN